MKPVIDLRSDTVTRPTSAMRAVIATAAVGDDQYGEDALMNELQARLAALLGKEAALWCPSGTMANQVGLRTLTRPGDDVIVSKESHAVWHEMGASGANAGVQFTEVAGAGRAWFTADEFVQAVRPRGHVIYPATTLVEVENTHNRSGGVVVPQNEIIEICRAARERDIASYLDGARLWNTSVASGVSMAELAAPFDLLSVALSKGLGCPGGTVLAGSRELIARCHKHRRMFGGAMRQVGFYAAAGLYAIEHHVTRLADDHAHARLIGERLARTPGVEIDLASLQTNIIVFKLDESAPDAATVVARAKAEGVLVFAFSPRLVRAVTHLDVSRKDCETAADVLAAAIKG